MSFGEAVASGFTHYARFSGRASRPEFWFWVLFAMSGAVVANGIDAAIFVYHPGISPLNSIFTLVTLLPSFAVAACRLHDVDRSGWWLVLAATGIGLIVLIYWFSQEGTTSPNTFGAPAMTGSRPHPQPDDLAGIRDWWVPHGSHSPAPFDLPQCRAVAEPSWCRHGYQKPTPTAVPELRQADAFHAPYTGHRRIARALFLLLR